MNRLNFPGLNGIRAIAASVVVFVHIDQYLHLFNLPSIGYSASGTAVFAVTLFFVLSGYLITYLLLVEKEHLQHIDLKSFYIRRILRIWPVYYAVIIVSIILIICDILIGNKEMLKTLILYSFLLSNVGFSLDLKLVTITPLWSVGVEEQFYAFWPIFLSKSRNLLYNLIVFIALYLLLKIVFRFYENKFFYALISITQFDSMAIGGIAAYLAFTQSFLLKILYYPVVQLFSWIFMGVSLYFAPIHISSLIDPEIHSLFYAIVILNLSTNKKTILTLENKVMNFLGKLSYGLYMYHMVVILIFSFLYKKYNFLYTLGLKTQIILIYIILISTSICIALISYTYFEKYFLSIKTKYSKI